MNLLFLSLLKFNSFDDHNLYADLLRVLIKEGHHVYVACPTERRNKEKTNIKHIDGNSILTIKTLNIQKTNVIEKGVATVLITGQFKKAIKKHLHNIKFDLVLYATPPITLYGVVRYFKKRDNAKTYLMLKDIFPQNALDLGLLSTNGIKGILYRFFRRKEQKLYKVSDRIGCMSQANIDYVLKNNPNVDKDKIELFPNSIEVRDLSLSEEDRKTIREKYGIPLDKKVFIYGGNLGKPQNIPFIIECLKTQKDNGEVYFIIAGDGTDYHLLEEYSTFSKQVNFKLLRRIPNDDYGRLLMACDVGLLFLDSRFTIPNFPSRLLSCLESSLPVLACTDKNTDISSAINEGKFGWWCESSDVSNFVNVISNIDYDSLKTLGKNGHRYLKDHFDVNDHYKKLLF